MPTRAPISVCVRSSTKRIRRMTRSRAGICAEDGGDGRVQLHELVALIFLANRVAVSRDIIRGAWTGGVQRHGLVGVNVLEGVNDLLGVELQILSKLIDRGSTTAFAGEKLLCVAHLQRPLLLATGHVNGPS